MRFFKYMYKGYPVVTSETFKVAKLIDENRIKVSLDLGLSWSVLDIDDRRVLIDGYEYDIDELLCLKEGYAYILKSGEINKIAFYGGKYFYRLLPISPLDAPTLEISGVRMHRTQETTPWRDSLDKVSILNIGRGMRILDICTGLGYTAIHAYRLGGEVLSIELDKNVLDIASLNPWSQLLKNVNIILGDAAYVIYELEDNSIDAIIHDPPRLSLAGELYSTEFYRELYRVLRRGGRLFHYTGKVGYKVRGMDIARSVSNRLSRVGFKTKIIRNLLGVYAWKK